jgi:hypothetical protein
MDSETYKLRAKSSKTVFEFISKGPKGAIRKRVEYQKPIEAVDFYNLAFGDINAQTGKIDDKVISDNGDTQKVLATVAATVFEFMKKHPNAMIYVEGSTVTRTRLYRISISNNLEEINEYFTVLGLLGTNDWRNYEKNNNYSAFLIKKR